LLFFKATTAAEIDDAFAAIADAKVDGVFIAPDGYFASRSPQLAALAARDGMPTKHFVDDAVAAGLLMSYGTSVTDVFPQVGVYTGSIIKGSKPADLPVLQSTKFEFTLNLQTARSLGIDVRGDRMIGPMSTSGT
jgi:putative tryptophan/tyrosine transport system substrate-binding protein